MSPAIERYLQGKLAPDEESEFEAHYLGDSELLDELILAEKLKQGLQGVGSAASADDEIRLSRPFWTMPQYAAAAAVLLLVSIVTSVSLYLDNRSLRGSSSTLVAQATTRLVPLITVRGQAEVEIPRPVPGEWTVLLVDPGFTSYGSFDVVVTRTTPAATETIWQLQGLGPSYQDQLTIGLPGELLRPGSYSVALRGRVNSGEAEDAGRFDFRVPAAP